MYLVIEKGDDEKPLLCSLFSEWGYPLVHLGYAFELDSAEFALEALTLAATNYDEASNTLYDEICNQEEEPTKSLIGCLQSLSMDGACKELAWSEGDSYKHSPLQANPTLIKNYVHSVDLSPERYANSLEGDKLAVLLLISSYKPKTCEFDYSFGQCLASRYALRVILPNCLTETKKNVCIEHWMLIVSTFLAQSCPKIDESLVCKFDSPLGSWDEMIALAISGQYSTDALFVKTIRIIHAFNDIHGPLDGFWLQAASRFATQFTKWAGLGKKED